MLPNQKWQFLQSLEFWIQVVLQTAFGPETPVTNYVLYYIFFHAKFFGTQIARKNHFDWIQLLGKHKYFLLIPKLSSMLSNQDSNISTYFWRQTGLPNGMWRYTPQLYRAFTRVDVPSTSRSIQQETAWRVISQSWSMQIFRFS